MATSTLTIRLDSNLKEEAASVVEHYGLDLSTVTRAFYTQIVNTNAIPLSFDYERPNAESIASVDEARRIIESGRARFDSLDDMLAELRS